eukprot:gene8534-10119_t
MLGFATVAYLAVLVAFILLVLDTSSNYTNEVKIMSRDVTGTDGYTCEMISKVTNTYTTNSVDDPSTSYYLINIIESKEQCLSNLAVADPCSSPQSYIAGDTSPADYEGSLYIALGLYVNDTAYKFDSFGTFGIYTYANGTSRFSENLFDITSNFIGIDVLGNAYYLRRFGAGCAAVTCVVMATPSFSTKVVAEYNTSYSGIINDNLYNLYLYDNTTLYEVDYLGNADSQKLLMQLEQFEGGLNIVSAAVNSSDNLHSVYFVSHNASGLLSIYRYVAEVMTQMLVAARVTIHTPLVASFDYLFFPCTRSDRCSALCLVRQDGIEGVFFYAGTLQVMPFSYQSIAISDSGHRIYATAASNDVQTANQYFLYNGSFQLISYQYNFAAGWFTCGEEIVAPVPARSSSYTAQCNSNGIVGEVLYQEQDRYLFTPTDAATYAIRNSAPYCPAIYEQACNVVADLPPYSCTKRKYPTVFTVLGTAYANTMFLLSILIFVFSLSLTRSAKRYPPPGTNVHGKETEESGNGAEKQESDVEMVDVNTFTSTTNPITTSNR